MQTSTQLKLYNPRHPERTLLYQTVAEHYETWLDLASAGQFDGQGDHRTPKPYVRKAFAKYLQCGIFAHGFARARCGDCAHDYFVAFSCKGRGVCPSCNTRRMVETAAHLTDHVFPRLPVRQWVLSVPKRLRYFMQRDGAVLNMVLRIFLRVIAQSLQAHCAGAANVDKAALHIGAVAFIHRFGSSLNEHVHFHVCVVDGVFEEVVAGAGAESDADTQAVAGDQSPASTVIFHAASAIYEVVVQEAQATLRRRILRAFVGRGLLERFEAKDMLGYKHSGFSVDTSVRIEAHDRAGLERLLRYCARPAFSMERLRKAGGALVYRCARQHSEPRGDWHADKRDKRDQRGPKVDELTLTPLELIERIAALVPPPRTHRHRYYGALAPHSPLRAAVTAMAQAQALASEPVTSESSEPSGPSPTAQAGPATPSYGAPGAGPLGGTGSAQPALKPAPEPEPPKRSQAHYLWAVLIARIYEVFPLLCPICNGQMRIIAFITHSADIRHMLGHIGAESEPPRLSPARGPPLWEDSDADAQVGQVARVEPDWDLAGQPAPDYEVDQRINW